MSDQTLDGLLRPLAPGLFMLPGDPDGRFPRSHAFVVRGEVEALIDAGCGQDQLAKLLRRWRPDLVIISHSHPDHVSGLWQVQQAEVWSPAQRSQSFWRLAPQSVRFAGPELADTWIAYIQEFTGVREAAAHRHYDHGHVFDLGDLRLRAVHTPGHLDDHHVLWEESLGLLLSFDIDLTPFGPWYGHPESDIDRSLASIDAVAALGPRTIVSSHRQPVSGEVQQELQRFASVVAKRDARLLALLDRPRTVVELVDRSPLYGGHPYAPAMLRHWEATMIEKHLERLAARGEVSPAGDGWERT
jgi:endoribonuclease LACTB2